MNGRDDTERILGAYLAPDADRLPDRVIDAALDDIARTRQRRALRVPWRFQTMPALSRVSAIAAVALVAVVGAGGVIYLAGSAPAPSATISVTPAPTPNLPGITGFTSYTSAQYGITLGYPDGWRLYSPATRPWAVGQNDEAVFDLFINPEDRDGDSIALTVWQQPAGAGADISSREGLLAWAEANWCDDAYDSCDTVPDVALPMCLGRTACLPAVIVPLSDGIGAFFKDSETGLVTAVTLGRPDNFAAAARYGGGVQLLKSILTTVDVWTPEPGQIP